MPLLKCSSSASDSDLPVIPLIRKKVVVVGDSESGKTWLVHRFAKNCRPSVYVSTVYEHYTVDKDGVRLSVWDTAGKDDLCCSLRPLYYPETDLVILCFDVSKRDSLANVKKRWLPEVKHYCPKVPIVLVGNKIDKRIVDTNKNETKNEGEEECNIISERHKKEIGAVSKKDDGEKDVKFEGDVQAKKDNTAVIKEKDADNVRENNGIENNDNLSNIKVNDSIDNKDGFTTKTDPDGDINVDNNNDVKSETYSEDGLRLSYDSNQASITSNQDIIDAFFKEGQLSSKSSIKYRENIPDQKIIFERQRTVHSILQKGLSMTKSGWDDENENEPREIKEVDKQKNEEIVEYDDDHNKVRKVSSIVKKGLLMSKEGWTTSQQVIPKVEKTDSLYKSTEIIDDVIHMALIVSNENGKQKDRSTKEDYKDHDLIKAQFSPKLGEKKYEIKEERTHEIKEEKEDETKEEKQDEIKEEKQDEIKGGHKTSNDKLLSSSDDLLSVSLVGQVIKQQNSQDNLSNNSTQSLNLKEVIYVEELPSEALVKQVMKKHDSSASLGMEEVVEGKTESQKRKEESDNGASNLEGGSMENILMTDESFGQQNLTENLEKKEEDEIFTDQSFEPKKDDGVEVIEITDSPEDGEPLVNKSDDLVKSDMKNQDALEVNCEDKSITNTPEVPNRNMKLEGDKIKDDSSSQDTPDLGRNDKEEKETIEIKIKGENIATVSQKSVKNGQAPHKTAKKEESNKLKSKEKVFKRNKLTVTSKSPSIFEKFRASLQTDDSLVYIEEGKNMANQIGAIAYVECSAKRVNGISEVFDIAIKLEKMKNSNIKNPCKCNVL